MASFGERFKRLRKEKDLKQDELIKDFNKKYNYSFTVPAVSQYENNKRTPETKALSHFADYFEVSVDYLLGKTDKKSTISRDDLSRELLELGIKSLEIFKDSSIVDFTTEELREIIEITERVKKRKGK